MKFNLIILALFSILQACSPSHLTQSSLSQDATVNHVSQNSTAQAAASSVADSLTADGSQSCDDIIAELGSQYLDTLNLHTEYTRTGMKLSFTGRRHTRTAPTYSVQFNPAAFGFSIKIRSGASEIAIPTSAFIPTPSGNPDFSFAAFVAAKSQTSAQINFHIARIAAVDNVNQGTAQLFCHNRLVGSAATYFPNPTHVDACKRKGGAVINGSCHFGASCVSRDVAGTRIHSAAMSGYTSCFNAVTTAHPDCVQGYGASLGYLASCPLINSQEAADRAAGSTLQKVNLLYRDHRARNPDQGGSYFWTREIDRDPAQLQVLESLLLQ